MMLSPSPVSSKSLSLSVVSIYTPRENWKLIPTHLTLHCTHTPSAMASLASVPVEILILIFTYLRCFAIALCRM